MDIKIRQYAEEDVKETIAIWNEVVKEGIAFPQKETLTESTGDLFFKEQTFTGIAYDEEKKEVTMLPLRYKYDEENNSITDANSAKSA